MMAELAPPWGKFGHSSGVSSAKELSWPIIIQSNFCSWNCKEPIKCYDINLTHVLSKLVLRNTNEPKMSLKMSYWANLFFELLLGLPNPLMPNKMSHLYQTNTGLKQRATFWVVTFIKLYVL